MLSASLIVAFVVFASIIFSSLLIGQDDSAPQTEESAPASAPEQPRPAARRAGEPIDADSTEKSNEVGRASNAADASGAIQSLADSSATSSLGHETPGDSAAPARVGMTVRAGVVERSLFEDPKRLGATDPVLLKLGEIFGWDIDFPLDMREGDSFLVIYEGRYAPGRKASPTILAAEYVNRGRAYRAIGFAVEDDTIAYFTPAGKRLRRMFLRSPVDVSSVSSPFSKSRYHPILNIWRAHTGVDYAAAPGAPVHATASGRVVSIGWNGGYGRTVVLQHIGAYSTLYGHLSRYREGLRVGAEVAQGDVIGYVGQSGLATGPHLHYEFRVNGEHRNPLLFKPRENDDEMIAPRLREEFFRVARARTARLDLYGGRHLASQ